MKKSTAQIFKLAGFSPEIGPCLLKQLLSTRGGGSKVCRPQKMCIWQPPEFLHINPSQTLATQLLSPPPIYSTHHVKATLSPPLDQRYSAAPERRGTTQANPKPSDQSSYPYRMTPVFSLGFPMEITAHKPAKSSTFMYIYVYTYAHLWLSKLCSPFNSPNY